VIVRPLTQDFDWDEYVDLAIRAFGPVDEAMVQPVIEPVVAAGRCLGALDGGRLVGTALYHDMCQWWHGRAVPMAGVAGVTVAPEYRGQGVGRALMTALTGLMAERGYPLSALYPATMAIYRSLGWEIAGHRQEAVLPSRALSAVAASNSTVAETVHAQVGPSDPLRWMLREQDADIAERESWMLRLLDAPAAIAARGFPATDLAVPLLITDDLRPANSGRWDLTVRAGEGRLSRHRTDPGSPSPAGSSPSCQAPLALGARGLAALYAGTPVATLRRAGLAGGGSPDADAALDGAFAATPFMLDGF
jgi:predicted acetyltransferase